MFEEDGFNVIYSLLIKLSSNKLTNKQKKAFSFSFHLFSVVSISLIHPEISEEVRRITAGTALIWRNDDRNVALWELNQ